MSLPESFLPKEILDNILYPYLTYSDLVNVSADVSILDRLRVHVRPCDQEPNTISTISFDHVLIYSIYLDNDHVRSILSSKSILVSDIINLHYHDRIHTLRIEITSENCKIEDIKLLLNQDTIKTCKYYNIYQE